MACSYISLQGLTFASIRVVLSKIIESWFALITDVTLYIGLTFTQSCAIIEGSAATERVTRYRYSAGWVTQARLTTWEVIEIRGTSENRHCA